MTAKEFLRSIQGHERRIKALNERKQKYYDMAMQGASVVPQKNSGMPDTSRVETVACRLADLGGDIDREIDRLVADVRLTESLIAQLEDSRHRDILRYRYLNGWSWDKTAQEMNHYKRWVLRLHGGALTEADQAWNYRIRLR